MVAIITKDQSGALVNEVMKLWAPQNFEQFLSSYSTGGFSRRELVSQLDITYSTHMNLLRERH
jgi:hypothetical protein